MAHRVAPHAERDLDDIWLYVAKESGSIEIANRLIDTITDRFFFLASFPYIGRSREEDFGPGYRTLAVGEIVSHKQLSQPPQQLSSKRLFRHATVSIAKEFSVPSEAQVRANQANAQHSTGPKTESGKSKSSLNAVKTGLTGRTVLLPGDDAEAYTQHIERFFDEWDPETDAEEALVQSLADTEWRLLRIPSLEMGIYAIGRLELADKFSSEQDEAVRKSLIEAQIFLSYRKDLNNLSLQESRLRRQRENDTAQLEDLQEERRRERNIQLSHAVELYRDLQVDGEVMDPEKFGFEFSIEEIEKEVAYWDLRREESRAAFGTPERREQLRKQRIKLQRAA